MTSAQASARRIYLGPALVVFLLALYKAHTIARHIFGSSATHLFPLLQGDLILVALLFFVAGVSLRLRSGFSRFSLFALALVLTSWFAADVILVLTFNTRLTLDDISRFSGEGAMLFHWISAKSACFAILGAFVLFFPLPAGPRTGRILFAGAALVLVNGILPLVPTNEGELELIAAYRKPIGLGLSWSGGAAPAEFYSDAEVANFREWAPADRRVELPPGSRNVILLVVESLSAADSLLTSGLSDRLPGLDRLATRGRYFTNFFANYASSEGGEIALHSALPPVHFPGASRDVYAEFSRFPSAVGELRGRGVATELLTATRLGFLNLSLYARAVFDTANGRDELPRFAAAPRFSFDSPADSVLFDEALERLGRLASGEKPYFFSIITTTSHLPYHDPRGLEPIEENMWSYVDGEVGRFVGALDARNFFRDGLLIITGDHRKMLPVTAEEYERYGQSARARIPLLLVGAGVEPGKRDDRFFQQIDLLPLLARAAAGEGELSPSPLWIERYTFHERLASRAADVSFFLEREGGRTEHRLRLEGAHIRPLGEPAPEGARITELLHGYRSRFQAARANTVQSGCRPPAVGGTLFGIEPGLEIVSGADALGADLPRAARGAIKIGAPGLYWFGPSLKAESCVWVDGTLVAYRRGAQSGRRSAVTGALNLGTGPHRLIFSYGGEDVRAAWPLWLAPGVEVWLPVPESALTH